MTASVAAQTASLLSGRPRDQRGSTLDQEVPLELGEHAQDAESILPVAVLVPTSWAGASTLLPISSILKRRNP